MTKIKCALCDELATWMRYTQFASNHPFCDKHAEMESDFQPSLIINDDGVGVVACSYFKTWNNTFWERLDNEQT